MVATKPMNITNRVRKSDIGALPELHYSSGGHVLFLIYVNEFADLWISGQQLWVVFRILSVCSGVV